MKPCVFLLLAVAAAPGAPLRIEFNQPAKSWEKEALPVGNGRLGAMVFGDPARDRIQFNEDSLWSGGSNESGDYKVEEFGTFQSFGDLFVTGSGPGGAAATSTSGQKPFVADEGVDAASDGDKGTKWCVEHGGRPVVWQIDLGREAVVKAYSFTSANDVPARDPRSWKFEGSRDGKDWTLLDHHEEDQGPFPGRGQAKRFECPNTRAWRFYRFVFAPASDATHFQVAEIALDGVGGGSGGAQGYSRVLDLETGIHAVAWSEGGARLTREVFASHPDRVIVVRLAADRPGAVTGGIELADPRKSATQAEGKSLSFQGRLANGLRYAARVQALAQGGELAAADGRLTFRGCDSVVLVLAAATDYAMDPGKGFRSGKDPVETASAQCAAAIRKPYDALRSAHVADHQALMGRVKLDLGSSGAASAQPTPSRLQAYAAGGADPELEALLFQFGRYLLVGCSRPGDLPANLQGVWADGLKPAWYADYHTNINIQMNYWLAEPANLAECHQPLFDWVIASIPGSRDATRKAFGAETPGWTMRTSVNIFGGNGWQWNLPASAWLAQHFWEHYAFGGDKEFLRTKAWPVLRDVSEFWLSHLVEKDGKLVVPKGWSPEHGPREDGVAHDQQIVWDLFTHTLGAASVVGEKTDLVGRIQAAREKLLGPQVGSWGQLMEWTTERPELEKSGHRHTSHLFAVYPGSQISVSRTPEWAKAAAASLEARGSSGDSRRSWTWPWRTALWARLGRPDKAHEMVRGLLTHNTLPNLWTVHPPFQMDGNFGITAGICEILLQSHAGEISVLPALPETWPTGSFDGLRARGGVTVGAKWSGGKLVSMTLRADRKSPSSPVRVRYPTGVRPVDSSLRSPGPNLVEVDLDAGKTVELAFQP